LPDIQVCGPISPQFHDNVDEAMGLDPEAGE